MARGQRRYGLGVFTCAASPAGSHSISRGRTVREVQRPGKVQSRRLCETKMVAGGLPDDVSLTSGVVELQCSTRSGNGAPAESNQRCAEGGCTGPRWADAERSAARDARTNCRAPRPRDPPQSQTGVTFRVRGSERSSMRCATRRCDQGDQREKTKHLLHNARACLRTTDVLDSWECPRASCQEQLGTQRIIGRREVSLVMSRCEKSGALERSR